MAPDDHRDIEVMSPNPRGPLAAHRARIASGDLHYDPIQALAVEKLEALWRALDSYRPGEDGGWLARLGLARRQDPAPQGLYLCGGVGRGKSMLMDLFFELAPATKKKRVHFHTFMLDVHERLHRRRQVKAEQDPIAPLAAELAAETTLLCFDEFQITNIADAMILGRLFTALFEHGVVVVATSNTAPDDLYAGGLQRERFLPAIDVLKSRLDLLMLDGEIDYRRNRIRGMTVYHTPLGRRATDALDGAFARLTDGAPGESSRLEVQGRKLDLPRTAHGVVRVRFSELCERALGAADYFALAARFHTVIIDGVPVLTADRRNEARRFITLIDALYEHRVKLVCSAAAIPEKLHTDGDHAGEFVRTISRLHEMQSEAYLQARHLA